MAKKDELEELKKKVEELEKENKKVQDEKDLKSKSKKQFWNSVFIFIAILVGIFFIQSIVEESQRVYWEDVDCDYLTGLANDTDFQHYHTAVNFGIQAEYYDLVEKDEEFLKCKIQYQARYPDFGRGYDCFVDTFYIKKREEPNYVVDFWGDGQQSGRAPNVEGGKTCVPYPPLK